MSTPKQAGKPPLTDKQTARLLDLLEDVERVQPLPEQQAGQAENRGADGLWRHSDEALRALLHKLYRAAEVDARARKARTARRL